MKVSTTSGPLHFLQKKHFLSQNIHLLLLRNTSKTAATSESVSRRAGTCTSVAFGDRAVSAVNAVNAVNAVSAVTDVPAATTTIHKGFS